MKQIPLSQCKIALVDDEDYEKLNQYGWFVQKDEYTYYAKTNIKTDGKWKQISMHRMILGLGSHLPLVDHEDGDGLNNQKFNLRICTGKQNRANSKPAANTSSQYKGVFLHKKNGKWRARIVTDGKKKHLGYFFNEADAALAYNREAVRVHSDFALLNIVKP